MNGACSQNMRLKVVHIVGLKTQILVSTYPHSEGREVFIWTLHKDTGVLPWFFRHFIWLHVDPLRLSVLAPP